MSRQCQTSSGSQPQEQRSHESARHHRFLWAQQPSSAVQQTELNRCTATEVCRNIKAEDDLTPLNVTLLTYLSNCLIVVSISHVMSCVCQLIPNNKVNKRVKINTNGIVGNVRIGALYPGWLAAWPRMTALEHPWAFDGRLETKINANDHRQTHSTHQPSMRSPWREKRNWRVYISK